MNRRGWQLLTLLALVALYVLHNDLWLWNDPRLVLGLPVGLVYHLGFCAAAAVVLTVLVVRVWPPWTSHDGDASDAEPRQGEGGPR
jgi:hypothetical protein